MNLSGRKITLHDMCLRDGMHPKQHQITLKQSIKDIAELLEPRLPDLPVLLQPIVDLFHFVDLKPVVDLSPLLLLLDDFTLRQNA